MIRTAALAYVRDRRLLQARSADKRAFYMAGGKIDPGESALDALHREVREELGTEVVAAQQLGVFEAEAFGHPPGTQLHMTAFLGELAADPRPTSEIAEIRYFTLDEYAAMPDVAPGSMLIFEHLQALNLID